MARAWLLSVLLVFLVETAAAEDYVDPEAAGLPPDAVAVLRWPDIAISIATIDGTPIDQSGSAYAGARRAVLAPGLHTAVFETMHGGSVMHCGAFTSHTFPLPLELAAGRRYLARSTKRSSDCSVYLWVEDEASPEIVGGTPPPGDPARLIASMEAQSIRLVEARYEAVTAAAEAGDAAAQFRLGLWHLLGDLPLRAADPTTARSWLERAGARGIAEADALLARIDVVARGGPAP